MTTTRVRLTRVLVLATSLASGPFFLTVAESASFPPEPPACMTTGANTFAVEDALNPHDLEYSRTCNTEVWGSAVSRFTDDTIEAAAQSCITDVSDAIEELHAQLSTAVTGDWKLEDLLVSGEEYDAWNTENRARIEAIYDTVKGVTAGPVAHFASCMKGAGKKVAESRSGTLVTIQELTGSAKLIKQVYDDGGLIDKDGKPNLHFEAAKTIYEQASALKITMIVAQAELSAAWTQFQDAAFPESTFHNRQNARIEQAVEAARNIEFPSDGLCEEEKANAQVQALQDTYRDVWMAFEQRRQWNEDAIICIQKGHHPSAHPNYRPNDEIAKLAERMNQAKMARDRVRQRMDDTWGPDRMCDRLAKLAYKNAEDEQTAELIKARFGAVEASPDACKSFDEARSIVEEAKALAKSNACLGMYEAATDFETTLDVRKRFCDDPESPVTAEELLVPEEDLNAGPKDAGCCVIGARSPCYIKVKVTSKRLKYPPGPDGKGIYQCGQRLAQVEQSTYTHWLGNDNVWIPEGPVGMCGFAKNGQWPKDDPPCQSKTFSDTCPRLAAKYEIVGKSCTRPDPWPKPVATEWEFIGTPCPSARTC